MNTKPEDYGSGSRVFETSLTGIGRVPLRLALGFLSGGVLSWALFFVCLPTAVLVAAVVVDERFAPFSVGLSLLLLLACWWTSYRYVSPSVTLDPDRGTLRIEHDVTPAWTRDRTVDLTSLDAVLLVPLSSYALVRFEYRDVNLFRPWDVLVTRSDLPALKTGLRERGVRVRSLDGPEVPRIRAFERPARLVLTPVVLVGIPIVALLEFGPSALEGDVVFITVIVAVWSVQAELTQTAGVRPDRFSLGLLLDALGTVVALSGLYGVYVLLT